MICNFGDFLNKCCLAHIMLFDMGVKSKGPQCNVKLHINQMPCKYALLHVIIYID